MRKTLTDLFYEYDTKRNRSESIARANFSALMERYPKLRELKAAHDEAYFSAMRESLSAPARKDEIMAAAKAKAEDITEQIDIFCRENGIDLSLASPVYECEKCGDTGYVTVNNAKTLCPCIVEKMRIEVYGGSPIDELEGSFERYDLTVFKDEQQRNTAEKLCKYARNYCGGRRKTFTVLKGSAGLGKSYLMHCMAKELKKAGEDVLFIGAFDMFECFKLNRIGEMNNLAPVMDAGYLFIDDLGSEPVTQNVTREYFFNLLENRTEKGLYTVVSTNLNNVELQERYGDKVMSRLLAGDRSDAIKFEGKDIRLNR